MKQVGASVLAVILCLVGFRCVSPVSQAGPESAFRIAYLIDRNTHFDDEASRPENVLKDSQVKIETVYSWQDLLNRNARQPFDALMIHESAVPMVNFEWVANAYWNGVTISTIDIYPSMLAHLFDDACLPYGDTMPIPDDGPYFTVSTNLILSLHDQTQVVKWFRRDWRRNCNRIKPIEAVKATSATTRYTSGVITDEKLLPSTLIKHLQYAQEERELFIEEYKDPQGLVMQLPR